MIKKMLHKVIIGWCLYGLYCIVIFVHPWLFWLAARIKPYFDSNEKWDRLDPVPWDASDWEQVILVWVCTILIVGFSIGAYSGLGAFCEWLFLSHEEDE